MNCEAARDRLLEAEPAELAGQAVSELARHVRMCAGCRKRAELILAQYAALRETLDRAVPPAVRPVVIRASKRRWAVLIPLAVAAGLAVLLLGRRREPAAPPASAGIPQLASAGEALDVQAPPGRTVAVFRTDNPNIVVIWSF